MTSSADRWADSVSKLMRTFPGGLAADMEERLKRVIEDPLSVTQRDNPARSEVPLSLPETEPAIRAALAHSFTLSELGPDRQLAGATETTAVLNCSQSITIAGKRRLRLTDEARADLLEQVRETPRFQELLNQACDEDKRDFDAISDDEIRRPTAWLRCFLSGTWGSLDLAPPPELDAAVKALESLRLVELGPDVPRLEDARRLLELAELLEPMRILIGASGGWDGTPLKDRFVGRSDALMRLRSFVDELQSESASEFVTRSVGRAIGSVQRFLGGKNEGVFVVSGRGGLGKSTLIARFLLDHALSQERPFPFAYLDFDRASLQPREPLQLLRETARQVALQFPAISGELKRIRTDLLEAISGAGTSRESELFAAFRNLLASRVTKGKRALLVVLDTMELVQYDPSALEGVVRFIDQLSTRDLPELRIVAAGRAAIPELRMETSQRAEGLSYTLSALTVGEAAAFAQRLGSDLLGGAWRRPWSKRIAGVRNDPDRRREPLAVRVAIELIRSADPARREALVEDIARLDHDVHQGFIGPLYKRRILEHVRDPEARKLAWPGLILRRLTPEIVRDVLATPCGLDRSRLDATFDALAREVWIVTRHGEALQHQPDLRSRTLPLMREYDQKLFDRVNSAAVTYFESRQLTDWRAKVEWIYHRLLRGESPTLVDIDWNNGLAPVLAAAVEDFDRASDAGLYLAARTAVKLLPRSQILQMPPDLALDHIERTASDLGAFDDRRIEPILVEMPLLSIEHRMTPEPASSARTALAVKLGAWVHPWCAPESAETLDAWRAEPRGHGWDDNAAFALRFMSARNVQPADVPPFARHRALEKASSGRRVERSLFRVLAQDFVIARIQGDQTATAMDSALATMLSKPSWRPGYGDLSVLRTLVVFADQALRPAARLWLELRSEFDRRSEPVTLGSTEIQALLSLRAIGVLQADLAEMWEQVETESGAAATIVSDNTLRARFETDLRGLISDREVNPDVGPQQIDRALRRFAGARDEDWLIPLGYAAARASRGLISDQAHELASTFDPRRRGLFDGVFSSKREHVTDVLQALRIADEVGQMPAMTSIFLGQGTESDAVRDLQYLRESYDAWRKRILDRLSGSLA